MRVIHLTCAVTMESRLIDKTYLSINANLLLPGRRQSLKDKGVTLTQEYTRLCKRNSKSRCRLPTDKPKMVPNHHGIIVGLKYAFDWHLNK